MEFQVLGPVEVRVDGRLVDAGHARQRAVLAVLLLDAGRAVPTELLIDRVWGDDPPRSVRNVVYGYVARLKTLVCSGQDPGVSLSRRTGGYVLQAGPDRLDLGRFRRLVAVAAASGDDDERAAVALSEAVGLWRGPALAGLDSRWLKAMRVSLELERAATLVDLNDIRLRRGEHGKLAGELAAQAAASPADERLIGQLMLALHRCGRQADALRWYERIRNHLAGELGADPGPQLAVLHQQILRADPALTYVPASGSRPAAPRAGNGSAGPHTGPVPRELPADVPAFTGRTAELAELDHLLVATTGADASARAARAPVAGQVAGPGAVAGRAPAAVISAVSGTAGVGKTALAVHWAHRTAGRFPDGQLYVNLRGYDPDRPVSAADALAGFLRALGVPGQDIPPGEDERAVRYRSLLAGQRMLVVLDNASQADQIRPLLPGTPGCAVVVTSRDALADMVARDGAARLDLDLLPLEDAVSLLRELIGTRADADPAAAAELARQCCRLPLALRVAAELAASRPHIPLADAVKDLADQQKRLDLLDAAGDPRTEVRAVFSWSYRHLDPGAARAFRLAGLHPGPDFDPCALAALAASTLEQARESLDVLARAHLIQVTGPGRYSMHDLLRAYARELVATHDREDDRNSTLTGLIDHYLHTAATAMDTLYPAERYRRPRTDASSPPVPQIAQPDGARIWLDAERPVLVAVAAYAANYGWPGHATRLAVTLLRYLQDGGHFAEAVSIHSSASRAARLSGDHAAEATALANLALVDWRQGRFEQAIGHCGRALALFRDCGDLDGQARVQHALGLVCFEQGSYQQCAHHFEQELALYRKTGERMGQATALTGLGRVDQQQGRYQQAAGHFRQALQICRQADHRTGEAIALGSLGVLAEQQGRYQEAADHHRHALTLFRETGDRPNEAYGLGHLGVIDQRLGRHRQAIDLQRQALMLFREIADRSGEAESLNNLGEALLADARPVEARTQHAVALELASQIGHKHEQARAHNGLGHAYQAIGDQDQARQHWEQALSIFIDMGAPEANEVRAYLATAKAIAAADHEP